MNDNIGNAAGLGEAALEALLFDSENALRNQFNARGVPAPQFEKVWPNVAQTIKRELSKGSYFADWKRAQQGGSGDE